MGESFEPWPFVRNLIKDVVTHNQSIRDSVMSAPPVHVPAEEESTSDEELKSLDDDVKFQMEIKDETEKVLPFNTKALTKDEPTYKLEMFEKKYLMVFNQNDIDGYIKPRTGTEKDVEALEKTFSKCGFEVEVHNNFTKSEIFEALKIFKKKDFTEYGCVGVAVLTHGTIDGLLRAKDQLFSETEIINHFKTHDKPTLITKPKILIIQACRGTNPIRGVFARQMGKIHKDVDEDPGPYTLPIESDILVFHSSYPGNPSHRYELYGSWFIQALCRQINLLSPTTDFESIMTAVKRDVAIDMEHEEFNTQTGDIDINKQMPVLSSTLIRKLYLKTYGESPTSLTFQDGESTSYSMNEVLDCTEPQTPLLTQFGPCLCFIPHFEYLRQCLRHFVEENPDDAIAESYLEICETFEDITEFNAAKEKMVRKISQHLEKKIPELENLKYLYLYRN